MMLSIMMFMMMHSMTMLNMMMLSMIMLSMMLVLLHAVDGFQHRKSHAIRCLTLFPRLQRIFVQSVLHHIVEGLEHVIVCVEMLAQTQLLGFRRLEDARAAQNQRFSIPECEKSGIFGPRTPEINDFRSQNSKKSTILNPQHQVNSY